MNMNQDVQETIDWDLVVSTRVKRFLNSIGYSDDISKIVLVPVYVQSNPYMMVTHEYACFDQSPELTKEQRLNGCVKLYMYNSHLSFTLDELDKYIVQETH